MATLGSKGSPSRAPLGKPKIEGKAAINAHEESLSRKLGGVRQSNSGAGMHHKADIKLDEFLLDSKETSGSTLIIHGADLVKISREARNERKTPGLILTVNKTAPTVPNEWVMIPLEVFQELIGAKDE